MNFLLDAQLPRRLAYKLREYDRDAVINVISITEERVVVTKDSDFVDSFLLSGRPHKLLLISTGNITNTDLELLFVQQIPSLTRAFSQYDYLELTRETLIFHS